MARTLITSVLATVLCLIASSSAWAQKNNRNRNQQDEKRENQRVASAQKEVREVQADLNAAQQKLRASIRTAGGSEAKLVQARIRLRETREQVADKLATSMGIDAALAELKSARAEQAAFTKPLLEQLHKSEPWQSAKKAADAAKQEIEKLREEMQLNDAKDAKQSGKIDELTKVALRLNELERQATLATPEGQRLQERVTAALAAIEKIRKSIPDEKVDADPAVVQAKKSIDQLESEWKKHSQEVSSERASVTKVAQRLTQSQQKLQQAQAADARDRNRK